MKEREEKGIGGIGGESAVGSRLLSKGERKSSFWQVEREEKKDFHQTWRILRRLAKFIKISVKKGYFFKKSSKWCVGELHFSKVTDQMLVEFFS